MPGTQAVLQPGVGVTRLGALLPYIQGNARSTQAREQARDFVRVAGDTKQRMNPRRPNRGEEIAQIEAEHDALAGVRSGEAENRASGAKAVYCGMCGNVIEEFVQDSPLGGFSTRLVRRDEPCAGVHSGVARRSV
jgi:hypothetical protein